MKNIIVLRDNGDYNYIYGALLVNANEKDAIQAEINNIINEFYEDNIIDTWNGNTLDYVLFNIDGKFEYEFIDELHEAKI